MNQPKPLEDYAMNALVNATPNQTMTSLEIAELTGKRHDNVLPDIRQMLADLDLHAPDFSGTYKNERGNTYQCFNLPKRETLILVSGYNIAMRAKIIDRWQELEAKTPVLDFSNPEHLRNALLGYTEKVIALEHQVETLTPKAMALDQIADTTSLFTIRQTAKMIKMKERDLVNLLLNRGWAYRDRRDVLQPYADATARGYVTAVMTAPVKQASGEEKVFSQIRITSKGVTRLSYLAAKGVAA